MATRSLIGVKYDDHIKYVYCHWDGYPSHNGQILIENYMDKDKINELIELGDLSVLAPKIGDANNFDKPDRDTCVFYGRDRGETDSGYGMCLTKDQLIACGVNCGTDYVYLFDNGNWLVTPTYDYVDFELVEDSLARIQEE